MDSINGRWPVMAQAPAPQPKSPRRSWWRELAFASTLLMELSWVALWLQLLANTQGSAPGSAPGNRPYWHILGIIGGVIGVTYLVTRLLNYAEVSMPVRRLLLAILILLNMYVGLQTFLYPPGGLMAGEVISRTITSFKEMAYLLPAEFFIMILMLLITWRGIQWVGRQVAPDVVLGSFRLGVLFLVGYGVAVPDSQETPVVALYLFLFCGLLAMSAARIAVMGRLRGGLQIPFDRKWAAGILLAVTIVVAMAILNVNLLKSGGIAVLFEVFNGLIYLLLLIFSPVLWFFTQLIESMGRWRFMDQLLDTILALIRQFQAIVEVVVSGFQRITVGENEAGMRSFLQRLTWLKPVILWGTILLFAGLVLFTLRRHLLRQDSVDEEELESLLDQQNLLDLLRKALRRRLDDLAEKMGKVFWLGYARQVIAAARIRRIYARLMNLASRMGKPRPASRTPLEFLPELGLLFPNHDAELNLITGAYLKVRYGELPETQAEVEAVETAWGRVSADG